MKKCELTKRLKKQLIITTTFFVLFSIISFILFYLIPLHRWLMIFLFTFGVAVYLFVVCLCFFKDRITVISNKLTWLTEENALLKKNIEPFYNRMEEIDKFRHDARNYMSLIKHESECTVEKNRLADELLAYADSLYYERICENVLVNLLLNDKKAKASECDIKFESKVVVPANISVASKDLCSLFFNLIDNAIYANETSSKTSGKWITVKSNIMGNYLIIKQSNSIYNNVDTDGKGNFFTTKLNKTNHGKGLEIIKDIAKKYNGSAEFETKNNVFYSTVYLYLYLDDYTCENMQNMTN